MRIPPLLQLTALSAVLASLSLVSVPSGACSRPDPCRSIQTSLQLGVGTVELLHGDPEAILPLTGLDATLVFDGHGNIDAFELGDDILEVSP